MKKVLLSIALISSAFLSQAQLGGMAMGIGSQVVGMRPQAKLQKHIMLNVQTVFSLGISNIIPGGKVSLPPTFVSAEFGVLNNYTIGVMLGTTKSQSAPVYDLVNSSILGGIFEDTTGGTHYYDLSSTLIGVTGKYNFVGGPKTNLFLSARTGFKLSNKSRVGDQTTPSSLLGTYLGDNVATAFDAASKAFFSSTLGANIFIDKDNKFALTPEIGLGTGWGDGINLGAQSLLLSIGATYHIAPAKLRNR